jgi:hypothetical protein
MVAVDMISPLLEGLGRIAPASDLTTIVMAFATAHNGGTALRVLFDRPRRQRRHSNIDHDATQREVPDLN